MANFDHLTTDISKFWPWSWSKMFDHLTMTPGRRPNGQKNHGHLTPPIVHLTLSSGCLKSEPQSICRRDTYTCKLFNLASVSDLP